MVHVPATTTAPPRRRPGRPPKNRPPTIPITAPEPTADGEHPPAPVVVPTFVTSLNFPPKEKDTSKKSQHLNHTDPSPPTPQKSLPLPAPTPAPPTPAAQPENGITNTPPLYEIMRGRAPRKSKIDAMAAISARSVSPTDISKHGPPPRQPSATPVASSSKANGIETPKIPIKPTLPEAPEIDLSSVKLPTRQVDPPRPVPRPFEIEDCPAFYPTMEEFNDPMAYVKSIADRARPYGICKVVPPEGWRMPFVIDTKVGSLSRSIIRLHMTHILISRRPSVSKHACSD